MKRILFGIIGLLVLAPCAALGQAAPAPALAEVVTSCNAKTYSVGSQKPLTMTADGGLCLGGGGSAGTPGGNVTTVQGVTGGTPQNVFINPSAAAAQAPSSVQCTAACASIGASGAHNLYGINFSATVTGWLLVYDATTCPANGTVTPLRPYAYTTANATVAISQGDIPRAFATGIIACFSTTGPYTATASTTAFIGLDYK